MGVIQKGCCGEGCYTKGVFLKRGVVHKWRCTKGVLYKRGVVQKGSFPKGVVQKEAKGEHMGNKRGTRRGQDGDSRSTISCASNDWKNA